MSIITNEILIPKKIFGAKVDKELELDAQLPDYCPDIARLVKVDCTPFAERCDVEGDKAILRGRAVFDLLYETEYKSRLTCCTFTSDFEISLPFPHANAQNVSAFASIDCTKINCRLISTRRIMIKSSLNARFDIEGEEAVRAVAVEDSESLFFRKKTVGFEGKTELYEEEHGFSENLPLNQSEKNIGGIVCGNVYLQSPQVSLSYGSAEIKTSASVHVLCEEEEHEGRYYMAVKTVPVSISIANDAIEDFKRISADLLVVSAEFSPELDQYGESRIIKADFTIKAGLRINEPKAYTVAEDFFEKGFDSISVISEMTLPRQEARQNVSFTLESKLDAIEPKPLSILDATAKDIATSAVFSDDGISVSGNLAVALTTITEQGIHCVDRTIPFEQTFSSDVNAENASISLSKASIEAIPTLHSDGTASIKLLYSAEASILGEQTERFVSDVTKRTPIQADASPASLIYCFPQRNEDLWSIAKLYRVSPDDIASLNKGLFDEKGAVCEKDKPILIKC